MNHGKPVTIRGVQYPSASEAARALQVNTATIHRARQGGYLDRVGLQQRRYRVPARIQGVTYPSIRDAARALGVHENTVRSAIERGTTDRIGMGRGNHNGPRTGRAKPVTFGSWHFASLSELSRFLGRSNNYTSWALRRGRTDLLIKQIQARVKEISVAAETPGPGHGCPPSHPGPGTSKKGGV